MSTRTLDYGKSTPFSGMFGRPRSLVWPVHAYRITIPEAASGGHRQLNPFERVILDLIDAVGGLDEAALAEETFIPLDLVRNVVLRLRDRGLIDPDNRVTDHQRRKAEVADHDSTYTSAIVFRELVGGEILPFIHVLDDSNPIKTKTVDQYARTLREDSASAQRPAPNTRDVINAIIGMKKRAESHRQQTRTPTIEQIRVEREPERYFLECQIGIQTRDADFRIADPFGVGFSRALEGAFSRRLEVDTNLQEWMNRWLESLASPRETNRDPSMGRGPHDTPGNRQRYPNLIQVLTPTRGESHRSITDIYAAIEWALFYTCEIHGPDIAIRRLQIEAGPDYSSRLSSVATSVGFEVPPFGFRPIPKGRLDDYTTHKTEMGTVLAISLLQAESDIDHPLRSLARLHPDFITRIRTLASDRGNRAHGTHVTLTSGSELDSDEFMREVVSTLLPTISFDTGKRAPAASSQAELLLDARTSLLDAFGYQAFNRLGPDARNSLIEAEKYWLVAEDGDDARDLVLYIYAALQGVLRTFLGGAATLSLSGVDYGKHATTRAENAGLGPLPPAIASVNVRRIRETVQGKDQSVGASIIGLLLTASDGLLSELARLQPSFLADASQIHAIRGHGNQPIPMTSTDAKKFRDTAITTLVTMLDLGNED